MDATRSHTSTFHQTNDQQACRFFYGNTSLKISETAYRLLLATRATTQALKLQNMFPSIKTTINASKNIQAFENYFSVLARALEPISCLLSFLQRDTFIEDLKCFKKGQFLSQIHLETFKDFIKEPGNLERMLSTDFCARANIDVGLFLSSEGNLKTIPTDKLDVIIEQARRKKIINGCGLILSLLFSFSYLVSLKMSINLIKLMCVFFVPFAIKWIIEVQMIDNVDLSWKNYLPNFLRKVDHIQRLAQVKNWKRCFGQNRVKLSHYLTAHQLQYLNQQINKKTEDEFSVLVKQMVHIQLGKAKTDVLGHILLTIGGCLSLIPVPAIRILPVSASLFGLFLRYQASG